MNPVFLCIFFWWRLFCKIPCPHKGHYKQAERRHGGTQRERPVPEYHHGVGCVTQSPQPADTHHPSPTHNNQPYPLTMADDYLDSLTGGRHLPLRGNPPEDSNLYDLSTLSKDAVSRAHALAATPPDISSRYPRTRNAGRTTDTTASHLSRNDHDDPREAYWKNNHPVNKQYCWGSIIGQFPVITPITEEVKVKYTIFNMHADKTEKVTGNWTEKTDFFTSAFEDVVPAAYLQSSMAIGDLDSMMELPVYTFADMEILDSNLTIIPPRKWIGLFTTSERAYSFLAFYPNCSSASHHPRSNECRPTKLSSPNISHSLCTSIARQRISNTCHICLRCTQRCY
jgi:hypothetical protein